LCAAAHRRRVDVHASLVGSRRSGTMTLRVYPHVPGRIGADQRPRGIDSCSEQPSAPPCSAALPAKETEHDRGMASRLGRDGGGSRLLDVREGPAR